MAKKDRVENPIVREFLYKFIPEIINKNQLFVKVYGERFSNRMIKENIITVYSNEPYSIGGRLGYHTGSEKSITFCCSIEDVKNMLTPEQILGDEVLQELALHEVIHAILERTDMECKLRNLLYGTGILEVYKYRNGKSTELGRGLNEGFTEWLCEKFGYKKTLYKELKNFVNLIELAIGTEKTMQLGKGGIRENFPYILDLPQNEICWILALSDQVYIENNQMIKEINLAKIISDNLNKGNYNEETQLKFQEEHNRYFDAIDQYMHNPVFLNYAKTNNLEVTEKTLLIYLEQESIAKHEKQKELAIYAVESMILDKLFNNELEQIFNNEIISDENFERIVKINSVLNAKLINTPEYIKKIEPPMSVILFKEKFEKFSEKYVKQVALRDAEKFERGELELKQFIKKYKLVFDSNLKQANVLIKEFVKNITIGKDKAIEKYLINFLNSNHIYSDNEEYIKRISGASIYKLKSKDPKKADIDSVLMYDKENYINQYNIGGNAFRSVKEDYEFDFTEGEMLDEYKVAMKNFLALQKEVFARNPNAVIHIVSREIVVQDGENTSFYEICDGELIPMEIEEKFDLKFLYKEKTQDMQSNLLIPTKVGTFAKIINFFKKKINDFKSKGKGKTDIPNYGDEKERITLKPRNDTSNSIDKYRVEDFQGIIIKSNNKALDDQSKEEKDNIK